MTVSSEGESEEKRAVKGAGTWSWLVIRNDTELVLSNAPSIVITSSISGSVATISSAKRQRPPEGRETRSSTFARMGRMGSNTRSRRTCVGGGAGAWLLSCTLRLLDTWRDTASSVEMSTSMAPSCVGTVVPASSSSKVRFTDSRARHWNRPSEPEGGASAMPTTGKRQTRAGSAEVREMVAVWSIMRLGWKRKASCCSLKAVMTYSFVLPCTTWKTSGCSVSISMATVIGKAKGLRKWMMLDEVAPIAADTNIVSMSLGGTPRPSTTNTQSPAVGSLNDISEDSTAVREDGVYCRGTEALSQGSTVTPEGGHTTV
mmetsp:Transcript_28633/g.67693  ORF Transcript_28633/g.67693 Transcript_28633/m.67693 type:complete len:316 (-) Transcript_28633:937-1884(-)